MTNNVIQLTEYLNKEWGQLVGAKLVSIRSATEDEAEDLMGWEFSNHHAIPILEFDNGLSLILSQDEEGNGAGFAFLVEESQEGVL
jgi:hypothetical protein